jgi:hypothetical protein
LKKSINAVTRWLAILSFCLLPSEVLAASPFANEDHQRVVIELFSPVDSIEIDQIHSEPAMMKVDFVGEDGKRIPITTFSQEGSSLPRMVSIFKDHFRSRQILFLIVKWHYYLPGVNTEADYYEVHAYNASLGNARTPLFAQDQFLSTIFGSGLDGKEEGKNVHFKFKDVMSIRRRLDEIK